jgi:hypothetical protein
MVVEAGLILPGFGTGVAVPLVEPVRVGIRAVDRDFDQPAVGRNVSSTTPTAGSPARKAITSLPASRVRSRATVSASDGVAARGELISASMDDQHRGWLDEAMYPTALRGRIMP